MTTPSIRHPDPTVADLPERDVAANAPEAPLRSESPPEPPALAPDDRDRLLRCARAAIAAATGAAPGGATKVALQEAIDAASTIDERAAAFVTLTVDGELRGCMGNLDADQPVVEAVVSAAASAAVRDPRFRSVAAEELRTLHVDVSVLGPRAALTDPRDFRPGIDGVVVERGWQAALLLPEVATELGWDAVHMLEAVCQKAGLPPDAWLDARRGVRTRLYSFRTVRFGGPVVVGRVGVSPSRAPR